MWNVEYYETENEKCPVYDFLSDLPLKLKAKAVKEIELLEEFGNQLTMPYSKNMQDGIYELRIQVANNLARIFYFFFLNDDIILTNGFIKKTQKTPPSELELALKYKADHERRFSE